jgi:hypothetical protein
MSAKNPKNLVFLQKLIQQISSDEMTTEFQVESAGCLGIFTYGTFFVGACGTVCNT